MRYLLTVLIVAMSLQSCYVNRDIVYDTSDLENEFLAIPILVDIRDFNDLRADDLRNLFHLEDGRTIRTSAGYMCINAEFHYRNKPVTSQLAEQLANHFNEVRLFRGATYGYGNLTDYYLTADLISFRGEQELSTAAVVGAQFGLVGALATSNVTTDGTVLIELANIILYEKSGELVADIGDLKRSYNGEWPADAYCWCIYHNINDQLKLFNIELIEKIYNKLKDIDF